MKITGIPSRRDPATTYEVEITDTGIVCTCDGFQFTGGCYHADAAETFVAWLRDGKVWRAPRNIRAPCPEPTGPKILLAASPVGNGFLDGAETA